MRRDIAEYFDFRGTDAFFDLVEDIIDRIDEDDFFDDRLEAVWDAIDSGLIYYDDQWEVLKHYCTPFDANWEDAIEEFANDVVNVAYALDIHRKA